MRELFAGLRAKHCSRGLSADDFAGEAASFLAVLNAIHPFREGNGRSQLAFLAVLGDSAGHPLNLQKLQPKALLEAMVWSFRGEEAPLVHNLRRLIDR